MSPAENVIPIDTAAPNYSPDPTLTTHQHRVINLLAGGATITEAAAAIGVHRNTIGNWRRTVPAFARELEYATQEQALYWQEQAARLAPAAIDAIRTILHNPDASPSLKLRAALAIVKIAADPHPRPLKPFPTAQAEKVAEQGESVQRTNMHNHAQEGVTPIRKSPEPGRNSTCPCGTGLKYKRCCGQRNAPATLHY